MSLALEEFEGNIQGLVREFTNTFQDFGVENYCNVWRKRWSRMEQLRHHKLEINCTLQLKLKADEFLVKNIKNTM